MISFLLSQFLFDLGDDFVVSFPTAFQGRRLSRCVCPACMACFTARRLHETPRARYPMCASHRIRGYVCNSSRRLDKCVKAFNYMVQWYNLGGSCYQKSLFFGGGRGGSGVTDPSTYNICGVLFVELIFSFELNLYRNRNN